MEKAEKTRENNFGFLRLFFAALVVVSHSPQMIDGNATREILARLGGTRTLGDVAVDGFFLISGYLITKSFVQRKSTAAFLERRILRIVPGYLVSFLVCVVLIAPFLGGATSLRSISTIKQLCVSALILLPPHVPGACADLPSRELNGSMWTIAYEFRCYIATALFGLLGAFKPRYRMGLLVAAAVLLLLNAAHALDPIRILGERFVGRPAVDVRFASIYGVGALGYLLGDKVRLTGWGAVVAAVSLIIMLFSAHLADAAITICGGYLIFWFAFKVPVLRLSRIDNRVDLSYGLYLYAWPVQNLVIWFDRSVNPWFLTCITLLGAGLLAYASWTFVEKPCMDLSRGGPITRFLSPRRATRAGEG